MTGMRPTLAIVLPALLLVPAAARAQSSASGNLTVQAQVVAGLSLTQNTAGALDFGIAAEGGSVSIDPNTGSSTEFQATGELGQPITVTFANATLTDGGTNTLTFVPNVVGDASGANKATAAAVTTGATVNLDGTTGDYFFWVGGDITVPTGQPGGTYNGTFTLSVAY